MGLLGLPLFRRSLRLQLALLLRTAAALLLIGVFLPELSRSIFASIFLPVVVPADIDLADRPHQQNEVAACTAPSPRPARTRRAHLHRKRGNRFRRPRTSPS